MRRRRLVTPLAVLLILLAAAGLVAWGLTQGPSMFSAGSLNAQAKSQTPGGQMISLGGVETHAALGTNCSPCHAVPFSVATMAGKCLACHADVQQQVSSRTGLHGKLVTSGWNGSCGGCHTEHNGAAGSLTVLDNSFPHDVTGFSLQAHHGRIDCVRCHGQNLVAAFDNKTCADCHTRRNQAFMTQHIATFGSQCVPCHDGVDRYGRNFDHSKLAFPLTGAHATVACGSCHINATLVETLKSTPQDCYSCHAKNDAHAGKFGTDCGGCHNTKAWRPATFDHSKTSFPLTGAHASIACDKCHVGGKFTAISTACVSCHAEPAFHAGAFGSQSTQCASCHTATAWSPATFNLPHDAFPLDHGSREQVATCLTCHPATVTAYTCLNCHRHTPQNVVAEHEGTPLDQLQDCLRCHANGRRGGG